MNLGHNKKTLTVFCTLAVLVFLFLALFFVSDTRVLAQTLISKPQTQFEDIFRDIESGYSIMLPKYWVPYEQTHEYIDGTTQKQVIVYNRIDDTSRLPRYINVLYAKKSDFFRMIAPHIALFTEEDLINFYLHKEERTSLKFRVIASKKISKGSVDGYEVEVEFKQAQGRTFRQFNQFYMKGDYMYVFEGGYSTHLPASRQIVLDMIESIEFLTLAR